ncbi:MAG: hypothetical protein OXR66_04685 [Candidatus Woesearchaeota archaeon]|nr:hypothetical protein [Candidatus Woesearchaeota archaeon]
MTEEEKELVKRILDADASIPIQKETAPRSASEWNILRHPHVEEHFLITGIKRPRRMHYVQRVLYNEATKQAQSMEDVYYGCESRDDLLERIGLGDLEQVLEVYRKIEETPVIQDDRSYCMRFAVDPLLLQAIEPFRSMETADWELDCDKIDATHKCNMVFGITPPEGIRLISLRAFDVGRYAHSMNHKYYEQIEQLSGPEKAKPMIEGWRLCGLERAYAENAAKTKPGFFGMEFYDAFDATIRQLGKDIGDQVCLFELQGHGWYAPRPLDTLVPNAQAIIMTEGIDQLQGVPLRVMRDRLYFARAGGSILTGEAVRLYSDGRKGAVVAER